MTDQHTHDVEIGPTRVIKRYVSWGRGEPDREWAALTLLAEHASGLAPEPIERREEEGRPVIVMSRVPGTPLPAAPLEDAAADALARTLRSVFAVPLSAVRVAGLGERIGGPSMMSGLRAWLDEPSDLGSCRDPILVAAAIQDARAFLDDLGAGPPGPPTPVMARSDGNRLNILWDGSTCRHVDWEDAGVSDLAFEAADLVEHVSLRLPRVVDADRLLDDLGLDDEQRVQAETWRTAWACFWLAMLRPGSPGWVRNPRGSLEDQAQHLLDRLARHRR